MSMIDAIIDKYSFYHFLAGLVLGLFLKKKYKLIFIIAVSWEIFEQCFLASHISEKWEEIIPNSIFDVILVMFGAYLSSNF